MFAVFAIIAAASLTGAAAPAKEDAEARARNWVALIDAQKYEESWTEASSFFRNGAKRQDWVQMLKNVRRGMGSVITRKSMKTTMTNSLPGALDGEYAVFQFDTALQNKAKAVETVTMVQEGGRWKAAGYLIN